MRRLITILGGVLLALAVTFAVTPVIVSSDMVRDRVSGQLVALTGYDVDIRGDTEIAVFPSLRFVMRDVALSVPDVGDGAEVAIVESLSGSISMLPLLTGEIHVEQFTMVRPRFAVEVAADGSNNWDSGARGIIGAAILHPESLPTQRIRIGDVRIEGGSASYRDARHDRQQEFSDIQGTVSWPSLAEPFAGTGSLRRGGERLEFAFLAETPLALLGREPSPARLTVTSPAANLSFVGTAEVDGEGALHGRLAMSAPSTRELLARLGTELSPGAGLEGVELAGLLNLRGRSAELSQLRMTLDGNRAEGRLGLTMAEGRIELDGTLAFETLSLDTYLGGTILAEAGSALGLVKSDPLTTPFDLEDLRKVDADIRVSASDVSLARLSLGRTAGTITVRDRVLTLAIGEAELYGGIGQGTLTIADADNSVRARLSLNLDKVATAPMMAIATDIDRFEGVGSANLNLSGTGNTLAELLGRLSGEARIDIRDGAVKGIDVARLIERLHAGPIDELMAGSGEVRTAFDRINGRFLVAQGTATTEDLRLTGPALDVEIQGDLHLVTGALGARGNAELIAAESRMSVPFLMEGRLLRPVIYPDPVWALARTRHGSEGIDRLRDQLERFAPEDVVDDVLRRGAERLPGLLAD